MPHLPSPLEACKLDLLTDEAELRSKYPLLLAERVMRLREMYNYWLANPSKKDRQIRDLIMTRFHVSQSTAYSDLAIIHQLVPLFENKSRAYHRTRAGEMLLETFNMAKANKDTKTMERASSAYAKLYGADKEDEVAAAWDDVPVQPFYMSDDPTPLGIKPIKNLNDHIKRLVADLSRDLPDIMDVEFEEPDLEEQFLFTPLDNGTD